MSRAFIRQDKCGNEWPWKWGCHNVTASFTRLVDSWQYLFCTGTVVYRETTASLVLNGGRSSYLNVDVYSYLIFNINCDGISFYPADWVCINFDRKYIYVCLYFDIRYCYYIIMDKYCLYLLSRGKAIHYLLSLWKISNQEWGLLSQFSPFHYFPNFSDLSKYWLLFQCHVHIWQMSPQLTCSYGDIDQTWMWFKDSKICFCKIPNLTNRKINEWSISNPRPREMISVFSDFIRQLQSNNIHKHKQISRYCFSVLLNLRFDRHLKH